MTGDVSGFGVVISDEDALSSFYRSEWSAVVRLTWTLTGRYDLAEELAQEASLEPGPPKLDALGRRSRRRRIETGLAVLVVLALVVPLAVQATEDEATQVTAGPAPIDQPLPPGSWRTLADAPLEGRSGHAIVWTGQEMLVWGGAGPATPGERPFGDGAAYDPATDRWRTLAPAPIGPRANPAHTWTGTELVIWGGWAGGQLTDGAAYDPAQDVWRRLAPAPLSGAVMPVTLWTGREVLVVGGINAPKVGAAYNPSTDSWRRIANPPGNPVAPEPQGVWTGREAVLLLTVGASRSQVAFAYEPDQDRWTELPGLQNDSMTARGSATKLVWTGERVLAVKPAPGMISASFDPSTRTWSAFSQTPADIAGAPDSPVWTGSDVLFWAGGDVVSLEPTTGTWRTSPAGQLSPREPERLVWADGVALTWGGFHSEGPTWKGRDDGAVYRPRPAPPSASPRPEIALPAPAAAPPDLVWVGDIDRSRTRGILDRNSPPATWQGRTLAVQPVLGEDGELVGYFGCRFFERSEVERADFDATADCPPGGMSVAGGAGPPPGRGSRPPKPAER